MSLTRATIPVFVPFVNRPDLLEKAIRSTWHGGVETTVIDNSDGGELADSAGIVYTPPVPLTFAQTQNYMLKQAIGEENARTSVWIKHPFYLFMHSDAEAVGDTVQRLVAMANAFTIQKRKWGVIFTAYDALAAFNTEAFRAVGGWDPMLEWYHSDIDTYYRLRLAGYELIESGLPVKHEPSQTLKADPLLKLKIDLMAPCRSEYYRRKWGGEAHHERFILPFNGAFTDKSKRKAVESMNPIEQKIAPPICACGKVMSQKDWQTLALGGGLRDQRGFACDTDGCEGNFPQRWKKIIEEANA